MIRFVEGRIESMLRISEWSFIAPEGSVTEENGQNAFLGGEIADRNVENVSIQQQIHFYLSETPFNLTSCVRDRFIRREIIYK